MDPKNKRMLEKDGYDLPDFEDLRYGYKEPFSHKVIQFIVDVIIFVGLAYLLYYGSGGLL